MAEVTLVDYGLGNIRAFVNIFSSLNIAVAVAQSAPQVAAAKRLILPGVGSFDHAIRQLSGSGMRDCIDTAVLGREVPVLGVCVGMQMMLHRSEEGTEDGLGWISGTVRRFVSSPLAGSLPLPHMGWNDLVVNSEHRLLRGLKSPRFYFLHSYFVSPDDPGTVIGSSEYGRQFASVIARDNVIGVQFHPEKSHGWGIDLLKNFAEL